MSTRGPTPTERRQIAQLLAELGIAPDAIRTRGLVPQRQPARLAFSGLGTDGRDKFLAPGAARAWQRMAQRARADGVTLELISAFRSYAFQAALLRGKRSRGMTLDEILAVNAPPGYSEHHTGRALDIGTPGCKPLDEAFEQTAAFAWLRVNARRFGFVLSYPRDNPQGYVYEPWHWRYR